VARRNYGQYCSLARALDRVGDRWILLLVRELLTGPKRFTDLQIGLRGMGPNLLSQRLKELEEEGLVRRTSLPPPAASSVYELTEMGRGLEPALLALARWGIQFLGPREADELFRPEWILLVLQFIFQPEHARGVRARYQFEVGESVFTAMVENGRVETVPGPCDRPDAVLRVDLETFLDIGGGQVTGRQALEAGKIRMEGEPEAVLQCLRLFNPRPDPASGPRG